MLVVRLTLPSGKIVGVMVQTRPSAKVWLLGLPLETSITPKLLLVAVSGFLITIVRTNRKRFVSIGSLAKVAFVTEAVWRVEVVSGECLEQPANANPSNVSVNSGVGFFMFTSQTTLHEKVARHDA